MIELGLTKAEIREILEALTGTRGGRYATPSLVAYLRTKELEVEG